MKITENDLRGFWPDNKGAMAFMLEADEEIQGEDLFDLINWMMAGLHQPPRKTEIISWALLSAHETDLDWVSLFKQRGLGSLLLECLARDPDLRDEWCGSGADVKYCTELNALPRAEQLAYLLDAIKWYMGLSDEDTSRDQNTALKYDRDEARSGIDEDVGENYLHDDLVALGYKVNLKRIQSKYEGDEIDER